MVQWNFFFWTVPTAAAIGGIIGLVIINTVLGFVKRSHATKGFLPMATTRGDRIFLSMVSLILIFLFWVGANLPYPPLLFIPAVIVAVLILKRG